jgi:hypothetical protein
VSALSKIMDRRIRKCLSHPGIILLALIYLFSSRRAKAVFPYWATQAL